jgi:hypothetical protein
MGRGIEQTAAVRCSYGTGRMARVGDINVVLGFKSSVGRGGDEWPFRVLQGS